MHQKMLETLSTNSVREKSYRLPTVFGQRHSLNLSSILNALPSCAEEALTLRLGDKIPVVRVHAVAAMARLQDPTDAEDPVTSEYLRLIGVYAHTHTNARSGTRAHAAA